jgi:Tol biopolymer transport system component
MLSKDELLKELWPTAFVEESNLSQNVFLLRRTLNGKGEGPEYIATVPRRGYRFVAGVTERNNGGAAGQFNPVPALDVRRRVGWPAASIVVAVGLGLVLIVWVLRGTLDDGDPRIVPVAAYPGIRGFPTISPDGHWVAFAWPGPGNTGQLDIWIKAVDGDGFEQLTATPESETAPAWSADGRHIAFLRSQGVFVVSSRGGSERKVAESGSMLGWTPDSQSLLVRDRLPSTAYGILQIDLKTLQRRQLTEPTKGIGDWTFDVSPDGTMLAFVRFERPGVSDVFVVPMAGGEPLRRTDRNLTISRVVWMPNGRELVYAVSEGGWNDQALFRIPARGSRPENGRRALYVSAVSPSISRPAAGEPARLAFLSRRYDLGLWLVDLNGPLAGGVFRRSNRFSDSTRIDQPGAFSRSGNRIAFTSDRNGWPNVWVANRDGSGLRLLTSFTDAELLVGNWSPDDQHIVIDSSTNGNSDIYRIEVDSGQVERLTSDASMDIRGRWSADGRWIYFTSDRTGRLEIWKLPVEGGQPVQITRRGGIDPQESPDGRTLFYLDRPSGPSRLMSVSVDAGEEVVVLDGVRFLLWSVTQQGIVFVTSENEGDSLDLYSFEDRKVRRLGRLPFRVSWVAGGMTVSFDNKFAVLNAIDAEQADVMLADRFR